MANLRDQAARRRLDLSPITTSINPPSQPHISQTPSSTLSSASLSAQFGYNPATYTPISAVRQYNPQQWTPSPVVLSATDGSSHFPSRPEPEVAPAPPPYSPPRSQHTSTISNDEPASGTSPATRVSPANVYRSSPEPGSTHAFPPPPPASRNRAGSNDRPRTLFGISAFTRQPAPEAPRIPIESIRDQAPNSRVTEHRPIPIVAESPSPPQSVEELISPDDSRPPASRRAVSTGAINTPPSSRSRGSSSSRWEPGMPLPPPPPGPPPPQSRSQSMTRTADRVLSPPTRRPGPMSTLGPVPPTPAGWVEDDVSGRGRSPNRGLTIDTSSINSSTAADSNSGSSSSGLIRSGHVRGEPKSIRERRNESKARKSANTQATTSAEERSNNPWGDAITPADITVPSTVLGRKSTVRRSTPRSARFPPGSAEAPRSADRTIHTTPGPSTGGTGSRGSTPRPLASSSRPEAPTPPFSPGRITYKSNSDSSPAVPPKALPTPPPQSKLSVGSPARPISHILHIPNNETTAIPPLVPSRPNSRPSSRQSTQSETPQLLPSEHFARAAIERHKAFASKEAAAVTNEERVRMFADFIVTESRLRRERYAGAIDAMGSEILELTRDLFRPYNSPRRESTVSRSSGWTPESSSAPMSPPLRSHKGSLSAALHDTPQLQTKPPPEPASGSSSSSPAQGRPESTWWTGYMPSLSPIPSMSVSEALDGSDSRGRPSSRWWEVSQEGSNGTPSMRLERSKRESKYMGMPKELREALQNGDPSALDSGSGMAAAGPSNQTAYGPDEYPPEKTGWHEENVASPQPQQATLTSPAAFSPAPITPNPNHLDVSRLVTLPPPYPRHHPAVNNNHPDLTSIRTQVRVLSDFTEVEATKERFHKTSAQMHDEDMTAASKRRNSLRTNIQREIAAGSMSYSDAAKLEENALQSEQEKTKEASKLDFELFQSQVVIPLNDLLMDRVSRATELFEQLRSKLFVDAQQASPNLTQEEGDEQPELLEKLTLLKWIFEAREQLHRELFDLLSDRNNRYRDMVITPYRLAGNEEKVKHAVNFFAEDAGKRKLAFEQEILKRTEEFMDIIEENVVRGVEVQLSAFWDIAPSLSRITEKVPRDISRGFHIQIPAAEYDENPAYYAFPMQYLYSLVGHCEKSTYQFIESQTNLLCLLHEVKSGVTLANCRLMKTQRVAQGENEGHVERELTDVEKDEEMRLTDDLKEKVRCVEELWSSALGTELTGVKERIMRFLVETGGWDDEANE
ncbi:hypothetical protein LARI1_G002221 [Lachnellula arida]|uniref:Uncharacterized protein n=1 Tax=Lachnellula arida TaxID=1316785 RepID=A0A8T9BSS3_9HELO|nr:hypothetical protein LARI1_G002221 [Lachnellula arida]